MKVWIYTHDPMLTLCRLPKEAIQLFGNEALAEDGVEVPDALVLEIDAVYTRLLELSTELEGLRQDDIQRRWDQ